MKLASETFKLFSAKTQRIFWILGVHAFALILFIIFIEIILGGIIFYKYVYLTEIQAPQITGDIIKFNDKTYQDVLKNFQGGEQAEKPPVTQK